MLYQSFQRKGKRITASNTTITSKAINNKTVLSGMMSKGAKAALDNFINNNNCGMMIGKPSTAIIAAFCCALAAIAAKKVKTRLRLHPPNKTRPMNCPVFCNGLPRKRTKSRRLSKLIASISSELNNSLDNTKSAGLAIE